MEHKTDRRQAVKTLGGLLVAGTTLAVPGGALAQARPPQTRAHPGKAPPTGIPSATAPGRPARPARPDAAAAPAAPEDLVPSRGGKPPPPQLSAKELQFPALKRLVSPHAEGSTLGMARLVSISGVRLGAASLIFKSSLGLTFQVDICKHDSGRGAHTPIASTGKYDLFVVNGGKGYTPTSNQLKRTVDQLARTINANAARAPRLRLLTLRKRLSQHPRGKFNTLPEAKPIRGRM